MRYPDAGRVEVRTLRMGARDSLGVCVLSKAKDAPILSGRPALGGEVASRVRMNRYWHYLLQCNGMSADGKPKIRPGTVAP